MEAPVEMPFIGRHRELAALQEAYKAPSSAFWAIYGRRRVGKSELIRHFVRAYPSVVLVGRKGASEQRLMRELLRVASVTLDEPLLANAPAEEWKQVIETIVSRFHDDRKLILVFDEFQWIAEKSPEILSVLQELWDVSWQHNGRVFLILCGSYIGFMERDVLGKQSPLFGRRTGQIFLKPFGYREAALFLPEASVLQKAQTYFICGGVPLYLRYFPSTRSVQQSIESVFLTDVSPLYAEPDFLLREELREVERYYAILTSLATKSRRSREIANKSGIEERNLHYYLEQLSSLGYIRKYFPLTGDAPKAHEVRYQLVDPLLRFWFHFVYPNTSLIAQLGPRRVAARIIPRLDAFFGLCFDGLCREALPVIYEREGVLSAYQIGSYWDRTVQIDVVGLREDGWTDLGECKWGADDSPTAGADELEKKIRHYPNRRQATVCRRLFMRSTKPGRNPLPHGLRIHPLDELYQD